MDFANLLKRGTLIGGEFINKDLLTPGDPAFEIRGPNGEIPNYIDPPTRAPMIIGVSITFLLLSLLFVIGRLYSRIRILRSTGLEDYFVVFSWVQSAFFVFCCCYCMLCNES
jgi:hypothetical protein